MNGKILLFSVCLLFYLQDYGQLIINPEKITIARDSFGVPHIFAETDAEVVYGLAWAHAEDDFRSVQLNLLSARKKLGLVMGTTGAVLDLFVHFMGTDTLVESRYEKDLSPEFRTILSAYVQGLNAYATAHPEEVMVESVLPFTEKDIITGYCTALNLFSGAVLPLADIFRNKTGEVEQFLPTGSNAFAMNGNFSDDGNTYLIANPHNNYEGRYAWYEAHVCSEEGLNFSGALFAGGVTPFLGFNQNLGWTHTFNYHDLVDVYKLTLDKSKKNYIVDGKKYPLVKKRMSTTLRLGKLKIKFGKTYYETIYGPALKNRKGIYAISIATNKTITAAEQWYNMCKADSYESYIEAMEMDGFPLLNTIYADKEGNIMLFSQAHFPERNGVINYEGILPGDTSITLWGGRVPFEERPMILNPDCGYIFNTNNTPFNSTCDSNDLKPEDYAGIKGIQTAETNRSERLNELFSGKTQMSFEELKAIKFDQTYPHEGYVLDAFDRLLNIDTVKYDKLATLVHKMKSWDLKADTSSTTAMMWVIHSNRVMELIKMDIGIFVLGSYQPKEKVLVKSLREMKKYYLKTFGTLEVPLGKIQRHIRGNKNYPIGGITETLSPTDSYKMKSGRYRAYNGDSFIQYIKFTSAGPEAGSVHAYGSSARYTSPHYNDQMEMYLQHGSKPALLDKTDILENAENVYSPGK